MTRPTLSHLQSLEAESIEIFREVAASFERPVMMYSIGKDSSVLLHLARKAFYPSRIPFPLLHIDTTWKFQEMIAFRNRMAKEHGFELLVHTNPEGVANNVNPFDHGSSRYTDIMKTQALRQALSAGGYDAAIGGARRDEEKSRAKERIFSHRNAQHAWDPKSQRPELWHIFNTRLAPGESMRVFPLSNWTELDIWTYIYSENIEIVPLYFARPRPVVERQGTLIMVDDSRGRFGRQLNLIRISSVAFHVRLIRSEMSSPSLFRRSWINLITSRTFPAAIKAGVSSRSSATLSPS
jgi:sulfate adenylyltransferase subunit 2